MSAKPYTREEVEVARNDYWLRNDRVLATVEALEASEASAAAMREVLEYVRNFGDGPTGIRLTAANALASNAGAELLVEMKWSREKGNNVLRKLADIERQYRAKVQRMVWLEKALGIYDERAIDGEG